MNNGELMATELRILQSRDLKEKIINEMKPEVIFPDLGQNIRWGWLLLNARCIGLKKNFSAKERRRETLLRSLLMDLIPPRQQ